MVERKNNVVRHPSKEILSLIRYWIVAKKLTKLTAGRPEHQFLVKPGDLLVLDEFQLSLHFRQKYICNLCLYIKHICDTVVCHALDGRSTFKRRHSYGVSRSPDHDSGYRGSSVSPEQNDNFPPISMRRSVTSKLDGLLCH